MADDKKNIPEAAPPAEAPAPTVENAAVPVQSAPELTMTDAEAVMLEHKVKLLCLRERVSIDSSNFSPFST